MLQLQLLAWRSIYYLALLKMLITNNCRIIITQGDVIITLVFSTDCRALCRIKLLPVTHVLVDTWMLTVKLVDELSSVPDDLKWATNTHMTPFTLTFKA